MLGAARDARSKAYAPYSGFRVGAALLDGVGRIHTGVNVENASYGLTVCAERNAVAHAIVAGARDLVGIAVAGPEGGPSVMPCGSCRQVLWEHGPDLTVVVAGTDGPRLIELRALLPEAFGGEEPGRRDV